MNSNGDYIDGNCCKKSSGTACEEQQRRGWLARRCKKVGYSGYAYTFDYADALRAGDQVFESHNVMLMIDAIGLPFLDGSQLDFVKEGFNETLKFDNPNAECGCGESFNLKK